MRKKRGRRQDEIVVTGSGNVEAALAAPKAGGVDVATREIEPEILLATAKMGDRKDTSGFEKVEALGTR